MLSLRFGCMGCGVGASFGLGNPTADLLWNSITDTICCKKDTYLRKGGKKSYL